MKSNRKKRILAAILCMVMVLSSNISALAEGEMLTDPNAVAEAETPEAVSVTEQEPTAEEPPVTIEQTEPETPAENAEVTAPEVSTENTEPTAPETSTENTEVTAPETSTENTEPTAPEASTENTEPTAPEASTESTEPTAPEVPAEETPVFSEETELTKELWDASGKLVQKVTAKLPKGAFEAETSQIEMEVTYVDSSMENYIKGMMEKKLPTDNTLGDYFLYNIQFKVNGEAKESLEPITITFEKSNLEIKDTKKANVFFFDPANPEVSGDKDELVEITQRSELLESLQAAGQSTATMEEDYDLSSIEIKEENRSGKIVLEGRKSTIYGCYVEKEPEQIPETPAEQPEEKPADIPVLNYEDDQVTVSVTAEEAGVIPEGAELRVLPITSEDAETKEQYQEVEKKIKEKVAEEEKEVAGFLAYDITFVDKDGNKMEPNGKVKVSMDYKKAELPQEVEEKKATDAEVTVLHLEEDENGEVKQVVDMGAEQKANVDTLISTEGTKVQNVEVETESFSVFTITWKYNIFYPLEIQLIDANGIPINAGDFSWDNSSGVQDISQIAQNASITGYTFQYAVYGKDIDSAGKIEYATKVKRIKLEKISGINYEWQYNEKESNGTWNTITNTLYFIYEKNSSSGGDTGGGNTEGTLGAPQHKKYIEENVQGQDYTLNLDVTGKRGEKVGVDVLLVLDKSGSMNNYGLMTPMKECVTKTIVPAILPDDQTVNRVSAISFSSLEYEGDINTGWKGYSDSKNITDAVNSNEFKANGGTNWELAMQKAENSLESANSSPNKKVVIFLSDGAPGFYLTNNGNEAGVGSTTSGTEHAKRARQEAVDYVKTTTFLKNASIYSVYLTQDTSLAMTTFANELRAADIDANSADGTNMNTAIQEILKKITTPVYKNVSIEDVLSEYVVLADEPNYKVQTVINGNATDLSENSYRIEEQPISLANDKQSTKIIVELLNGGELKENVTYRLSFHVKPSEFAISEYARLNGEYPHRGDEETDTPGKDSSQYTSSGKPGFYSNDSATLHYQENEGIQKREPYKKPVIQVQEKKTELTIKKTNSQGAALQGAEFELQKEGTDTKVTVTSNSNGEVILQNLMTGTYILKEIKAPSGYEKLLEEWKVIVQEDGENVTATLYKADGTTPVENNTIINYTETEIAEKNLKSSKTAKVVNEVVNEEERIFQIDLNAATSGQEAGQAAKGASIVLALDASSSMGRSGMNAIKAAAKKFVDTTFNASKISEIAIVWYQGTEGSSDDTTKVNAFETLHDESAVQNVKDFIDDVSHKGGTPMGDAMKATYDLLKEAQNANRYVIFFTDGMPGHSDSNSFNCMVANKAYNYANKIKDTNDGNAIIYTVGYNLSGSFWWEPGHSADTQYGHNNHYTNTTATNFLSGYIATTGKSFTVDKTDELNGIFDDIAGEIGALFTIQPEKIVDVIDARFELTDASKAELEEAGAHIISNADGTTTIEWTGDKATIGNENAGTDGSVKGPWSASFQIKAKDDFIGGNMIPTNGAASGIYLEEGKTRYFEQPSVNVKLLSLSMENKKSWYYKGDIIEPAGFMNELDETLKIHQLNNQVTDTGNPTLPELTKEQKTELVENGTLVVNANGDVETLKYVYPYTSDAVGYFRYTYEIVKDSEKNLLGNMDSHAAEKVGEDVEQYKLTVEFIPYSVDERDATLGDAIKTPATNGGEELNPQTNKLTAEGIYSVNVVAGEIQITKKLEEISDKDQKFSFVVTKDDEEFKTIDITIPAGTEQATYSGEELQNLSRGNYKIVESKATGYGVKEIVLTNRVNEMGTLTEYETDCKSNLESPKSVEFVLGNDKNGSDVIQNGEYKKDGVFGGVLFTNEEIISDWRIVKRSATNHNNFLSGAEFQLFNNQETYYGKSNENGLVEWYNDADFSGEKVEKLEKGSYTLKETKAPNLYAVSDEEWTVEITHDGDLKTIQNKEGKKLQGELDADGKTYKYYFDNVMLYELPSTGGPGIFVYTIGGTLLLMAAALLIYKMKREEVLKG
nr:SpaA isopeptide-forming pilin-related protein [uncultured Blautia sp.]